MTVLKLKSDLKYNDKYFEEGTKVNFPEDTDEQKKFVQHLEAIGAVEREDEVETIEAEGEKPAEDGTQTPPANQ